MTSSSTPRAHAGRMGRRPRRRARVMPRRQRSWQSYNVVLDAHRVAEVLHHTRRRELRWAHVLAGPALPRQKAQSAPVSARAAEQRGSDRSAAQRTVQRSAAQRSAVRCSAMQCNAVQRTAAQCSAAQCSPAHCSAVQSSALQRSAVQRSVAQCRAAKCSAVLCEPTGCKDDWSRGRADESRGGGRRSGWCGPTDELRPKWERA
jgi:hypothetical protein